MQFSGKQFEISAGVFTATVVEVGGGLRTFTASGVDVVDGYASDAISPGGAGQLLMPWPNRVRDGKYRFGDHDCQLDLSEPKTHNAIHGLVRWARWHAVDERPDAVTLEHDLVATPGYPWPLRLRTTWSVSADGLTASHAVTNVGDEPCPFGMGVHPYVLVPGTPVDDTVLTLPAHSRLLVDGRLLPIGAAKVAGTPFDFTEPRRIGTTVLDTAFGDVTSDDDGRSRARLAAPDGAASVEVWADGSFGWWQAYTGDTLPPERHRRSVALEPMTCPPDAFRSGRDLVTINPGDTWTGTWGITPRIGR